MFHSSVAAKVRADKEQHPEKYCPAPSCLWRVVTRYGLNPCKKHPQSSTVAQHDQEHSRSKEKSDGTVQS